MAEFIPGSGDLQQRIEGDDPNHPEIIKAYEKAVASMKEAAEKGLHFNLQIVTNTGDGKFTVETMGLLDVEELDACTQSLIHRLRDAFRRGSNG
jgi:hypothetical protein